MLLERGEDKEAIIWQVDGTHFTAKTASRVATISTPAPFINEFKKK